MPKAKISASSVQRIAIDGHFLDDAHTRLHSQVDSTSVSYVCAPAERHRAMVDGEGVTLKLPALTALQLFYDGVVKVEGPAPMELSVASRALGAHYLQWMHALPGEEFGGCVLLRFGKKPVAKERSYEPDAWLKSLVPLKLFPHGNWDPKEEYWGEPGEPIEAWAKPIIKRGLRPMYEMEQILPGMNPEDFESDPITQANDLKDRGKIARAKKLLEGLLIKDIRCLDAHAHLGNIAFDRDARTALDHYKRGMQIGELSLGNAFDGVLSWRMIDNRPFLLSAPLLNETAALY